MNGVKIVQYGCGKMSIYTMRYAIEKGATIVGAVDTDTEVIGKDIGEILGCEPLGVKIVSPEQAEGMMISVKPDVCIVTTMSLMTDVYESLMLCARLGVNAITTCEEAFYPITSSPAMTMALDKVATENNCTITGNGYQDVAWGNLISLMAGTTHKINKIIGSSSYNVEDYGIALAQAHGAGLSLEDFDKEIASADKISEEERANLIADGKFLPSYMWSASGWICDKLGLTIISQTQKCVPTVSDKAITSSTLNMTIEAGNATGMSAVVTTETKEGITIVAECIGKVYDENEFDKNEWTIEGEPTTTVTVNRPNTVELTCASVINRIPDLLVESAGFIPTSEMGELTYIV